MDSILLFFIEHRTHLVEQNYHFSQVIVKLVLVFQKVDKKAVKLNRIRVQLQDFVLKNAKVFGEPLTLILINLFEIEFVSYFEKSVE